MDRLCMQIGILLQSRPQARLGHLEVQLHNRQVSHRHYHHQQVRVHQCRHLFHPRQVKVHPKAQVVHHQQVYQGVQV